MKMKFLHMGVAALLWSNFIIGQEPPPAPPEPLPCSLNKWTQKADFSGITRVGATGFSIGNKGYIGTGNTGTLQTGDFWEYDPVTNVWTQIADFGGGERRDAVGFSVGTKGYIGTGYDLGSFVTRNDFWEYDPIANTWTRKADFGGTARVFATGFRIGDKGYIGTGKDINDYRNDFWEYNPSTNNWIQKANFPGGQRWQATGIGIGNKGYMGTGLQVPSISIPTVAINDFWEYNPSTNTWIKKADYPGGPRFHAVSFSIGDKAYLGTGDLEKTDFWRFDPATNLWSLVADFPGAMRQGAVGFSIGDKGYVGIGNASYYDDNKLSDFWEYAADTIAPVINCVNDVSYYKNESNTYSIAEVTANDNCSIAETSYEITGATDRSGTGTNASGIFNLGVSTITWTVKDVNNNTSTCRETVTIIVETMPTITICDQTWMQKNLNVTKYRNGDPIPQVTDPIEWNSLTTGAWCYYNNDPSTEVAYGKIYNWYAVSDPRGLAPKGWHIPNNDEWVALENCAGGTPLAGGALKEMGATHWAEPNTGATNSTGFTALPGGMRSGGGGFLSLGTAGAWWSINAGQYTHYGVLFTGGYYRSIFHASTVFFGNPAQSGYPSYPLWPFNGGLSIRCVKDIAPSFTSCPSNQTVYSTAENCNKSVTYDVVAIGNPNPDISYSFTGATSGSGSGTGSGQTFNRGITTVTVSAFTASDTITCLFTITVLDTIRPVVNCVPTQNLCYQPGNNYTIPLLTANDNCSIQSVRYAITGATVRSGSGFNASGVFNPGTSTIKWTVTDYSGNLTTCITTVRVNNNLTVSIPDTYPLLFWGKVNTIYKGFGPTCALLIAIPSGGKPYPGLNGYRYSWSTGATKIYTSVCPVNPGTYTYTVIVTDAAGCTATASKTIKVVDVRCGPRNNEITLCWFGTSQSCYSTWQAVIALYYGAQVGPCSDYHMQMQPKVNKEGPGKILPGEMKVFPNPNKGSFTLQLMGLEVNEVRVLDQNGKLISRQMVNNVNRITTIDMDLGFVANGIYLIQAIGKRNVYTAKVVVER